MSEMDSAEVQQPKPVKISKMARQHSVPIESPQTSFVMFTSLQWDTPCMPDDDANPYETRELSDFQVLSERENYPFH
jgi:hypothetical protein